MAVYDAMNQLRSDVCTVCIGTAASMGAFLLSGAKGKRFAAKCSDYDPSTVRRYSRESQ